MANLRISLTLLRKFNKCLSGKRLESTNRIMSNTKKEQYLRHLFDGDPNFNVYNSEIHNLSVGAPGPDLLKSCISLFSKSAAHRMLEEEKEGNYFLFQYGVAEGLWECRDELAKFLTRRYGDPVSRESLILTCGATHGLQLLLTTILSPNGVIFVDEVTYMIALNVFKQFPMLKIISVPMVNDVVDLDALEKLVKLEAAEGKNYVLGNDKLFWAMYYAIPTFHNPTGMTMSPDQMTRLVRIARENSFVVACDDVYNLLYYKSGTPPHRLFHYDDPRDPDYQGGNVVSNGSFSKILSPAIRLGWMECGPKLTESFKESGILKSGGAVNHLISGVIASALELKLEDAYLENLIKTYKERMAVLCDVLDEQLPSGCTYRRPEGGYFVWIKLWEDIDSSALISWCSEKHKVIAIPGTRFSYHGKSKNYLRVSIAFHPSKSIQLATQKLCRAIGEFKK